MIYVGITIILLGFPESRTLGIVAAVKGSVEVEDVTVEVGFLLEEEEKDAFDDEQGNYYPQAKLLRLKLFWNELNKWPQVLSFFDNVLMEVVEESEVERWVRCISCNDEEVNQDFPAGKCFQPVNKLDKCKKGKGRHGWNEKLIEVKENSGPAADTDNLSKGDGSALRKDEGWKYAVVICNDEYADGSGFPILTSTRSDFQPLIETLGNDHGYNLMMGPRNKEGRYSAGPDSTFVEEAEDREFINTDDVYNTLNSTITYLKGIMEKKNKTKIDSFLFYFIGHGVNSHAEDCMVGTTGKVTTISSIIQLLEERLHAEKYFLFFECCREYTKKEHSLNPEHNMAYVPSQDTNITKVFASHQKRTVPDKIGNSMTSALVDHLKTKKTITVNELEDTLNTHWVGRQDRLEYLCIVWVRVWVGVPISQHSGENFFEGQN